MSEAERYLKQVWKCEAIIRNKLVEIEQWKALAESMTAVLNPDKVQSSGSQQKMAEAVERYVTLQDELVECVVHLYKVKNEVVATIEQLEPLEYDVLHRIYIQHMDVQAVADAYGMSKNWAYKHRNDALDRLEEVICTNLHKNKIVAESCTNM